MGEGKCREVEVVVDGGARIRMLIFMVCCLGTKWKHSNCELQKLFGLKRYLICSVCFPLCTFACRPFKDVFMPRYVHERIFNILTSIKLCKKLSLSMGTQWQQQRRRLTRATRIEFYVGQRTWHERNARIINRTTTTRTWHAKDLNERILG